MTDRKYRFVAPGWTEQISPLLESDTYLKVAKYVRGRIDSGAKVYPLPQYIFRALKLVDYQDVKVVIVGQDPYHGPGQANGLAFGVNNDVIRPPSLRNILREVETDLGRPVPPGLNTLAGWARQGVLLLNSSLTVEEGKPGSHSDCGWQQVTDFIIKKCSDRDSPIVFLLWGKHAQNKAGLVNRHKHGILTAAHPSPLSAAGFFGCRHFSQTNGLLESWGKTPIDWFKID